MNPETELHAFGTFVPENAEALIIGTFPTHKRNRSFEFFYPNKSNAFWQIMETVYGYSFKNNDGENAVQERKRFVTERGIALTDMLSKAIREKDSSGDEQLIPVELMHIISILEKSPTIKRIVLTSRSGKINALALFTSHLLANNIPLFYNNNSGTGTGYFEYCGKKIQIFVPYSPSPRVLRRFGLESLAYMYKISLLE